MISNKQVFTEIKSLRESIDRLFYMQQLLIKDLRQDNRDLLNRVMVKNMREYALTSPASVAEMEMPAERLAREDEFSKELLAGEVIDET